MRIVDRLASTGFALSFPRSHWVRIRNWPEFERAGIYVLSGYARPDADLPTLYIGQGDGVRGRIDSHAENKDFWDWGFVFVTKSADSGLNRAHITWLEHRLIVTAKEAGRSFLDNGQTPGEPTLSPQDKADTAIFLTEILQVLPLMGLRAFERPAAVVAPEASIANVPLDRSRGGELDTVVVPAQQPGFGEVFLGQNAWWAIRIGGGMLPKIKYIAAYQTQPVSAVTHVAPVKSIEPYGEDGKYKLNFSEPAQPIGPIPFADAPSGAMQGPRYTNFARLRTAKKVADLF
ncbi:MAG: GIY-YIG nuclease family protein [Parvularculaceae bacterium]